MRDEKDEKDEEEVGGEKAKRTKNETLINETV